MTAKDAGQRLKERSLAAAGRPADHDVSNAEPDMVEASPLEVTRRLLNGLVEPEQMNDLLVGLHVSTGYAIDLVCRANDRAQVASNLYVALAQQLTMGILLAQPEPARTGS